MSFLPVIAFIGTGEELNGTNQEPSLLMPHLDLVDSASGGYLLNLLATTDGFNSDPGHVGITPIQWTGVRATQV